MRLWRCIAATHMYVDGRDR